jgi:hypothetical protein
MRQPNQIIRLLGEHYRNQVAVEPTLPIEMEVLVLRMALKELRRARCGGRQRDAVPARPREARAQLVANDARVASGTNSRKATSPADMSRMIFSASGQAG